MSAFPLVKWAEDRAGAGPQSQYRIRWPGQPRGRLHVIVHTQRDDQVIGVEVSASVVTRLATGSIAIIVRFRKRTPGLAKLR